MSASIISVSRVLPEIVRTNDWFKERAPAVFERAEKHALAQIFETTPGDPDTALFDECAIPYMRDPFRGTLERRVMANDRTSIDLEVEALQKALNSAELTANELDLIICVSFRSNEVAPGNAAFVAQRLNSNAAVMNIEATCSGTMMALQSAFSLVEQKVYNKVGIAISCTYSRDLDLNDSLSWFLGDGAGAIVVGQSEAPTRWAFSSQSTTQSCGAFRFHPCGTDAFKIGVGDFNAGPMMRSTTARNLTLTSQQVLRDFDLKPTDVDCLVINTPLAWLSTFATRSLGIPEERCANTYPMVANVGPALTVVNLFESLTKEKLKPNMNVLIHGFGTVSNAVSLFIEETDIKFTSER